MLLFIALAYFQVFSFTAANVAEHGPGGVIPRSTQISTPTSTSTTTTMTSTVTRYMTVATLDSKSSTGYLHRSLTHSRSTPHLTRTRTIRSKGASAYSTSSLLQTPTKSIGSISSVKATRSSSKTDSHLTVSTPASSPSTLSKSISSASSAPSSTSSATSTFRSSGSQGYQLQLEASLITGLGCIFAIMWFF